MKRVSAAVLLCIATSAARAQIQIQKLTASTAGQHEEFGTAVALDGDWALVGSPFDVWNVTHAGAVFAYQRSGSQWAEMQKLKAADPAFGVQFGKAVAIDGGRCVIGAPHDSPLSQQAAGSCYVFELSGGQWQQTAKLWEGDVYPNEHFGYSVAIDGDRLLIGARDDTYAGLSSGAAYIFDYMGGAWVQSAKLVPNDPAPFWFFGQAVSLSGDFALVSSPSADGPAGAAQGAAYLFQRLGSIWTQIEKLVASDGMPSDFLGDCVVMQQDVALVGASGHDHGITNSGSVYVYERQAGAWNETGELRVPDPMIGHHFGTQLRAVQEVLVATATNDGPFINAHWGAAYVFKRGPIGWSEAAKILPNDGSFADTFGSSVALDGNLVLVGALGDDDACPSSITCNSGSAYLFEIAPDAAQFGHCASGAPCGNTDTHGGCANSTGAGATLAAAGSSSVALDELRLEARGLGPGKSALVFMGAGQGQAVLGDGLRVVAAGGTGFYRYPVRQSDQDGAFLEGPGLVGHSMGFAAPGRITAGSTWCFQCWYRDPGGPCNKGTNLTNGVRVEWTP